ncbi:substrate-binding periplasmic protein [Pseudoduganella sp. OTU4001]|uniref:substrate-binding periplasmic protein n=1 Tax=Pseudoduganella sp. OTU4001 TaxID=3043854 RepID=UPI00313C8CB0
MAVRCRCTLLLALCLALPAQAEVLRIVAGMIPGFCEAKDTAAGGVSGVSCVLVAEMARRVGYKRPIDLMPQARSIETARAGPMVLLPLGRNDSRETLFQWHIKLLEDDVVLVARQDSGIDISSVNAVRDKPVGGLRGGMAFDIAEREGLHRLEAVAEERLNARKLAIGRISVWVGVWNTIKRAQASENLPVSALKRGVVLRRAEIHLAASHDVPLSELARWKAALDSMKADGTYRRILADYDYELPR